MKKTIAAILVLMMVLALFGCGDKDEAKGDSGSWSAVTVTDDLGREVTITKEPVNTAVLMGSFADIWQTAGGNIGSAAHDAWEDFDLGLGDDVTDLGSSKSIDAETLFKTDPDLIIASAGTTGQVAIKETMEKAGIPILYFDVNSFEDYLSMLDRLTDITGRKDLYQLYGLDVKKQIEDICAEAEAFTAENGAPRVLFIRAAASGVHVKGSKGTVLG
ncbi:MAG: ABC transporter substrate-binding protein, partial [Eubacteriaceae bacterium]|nr:ABC transporter substrate-binding protein [Eubacteriaceae bacterium]